MSMPYTAAGRRNQKERTRDALVSAARALVAAGTTPTVDDAAAAAKVSRSTAYRYFSSQRLLLAAAHPETAMTSLLPEDPPADTRERLDAVVQRFTRLIADTEAQQRTMLRLSLEDDGGHSLPLRQGRAVGWFLEALEPLRGDISEGSLHRLALAIRSAVGIEARVWLIDVARLPPEEASELMRWSARAMLHAALTLAPPPGGPATRQQGS